MKYIIIIFSLLLGGVSLMSCSNKDKSNKNSSTPHQIELIEGKKWIVDTEMMQWIILIANSVTDFNGKTLEEHQALAKSVSRNLNSLTSNCTMTGQAHDELHKWLLPFLDLSDEYDVIKNKEEGKEIVTRMKKEIKIFNTYFK